MIYKNTFWMNIFIALVLPFIYFLGYATDIDYVEHTQTQKIISAFIQACVLGIPIVTAIFLYKPNALLMGKLALIGNYCFVIGTIFYLIAVVYYQPSILISIDFVIVFAIYCVFTLPFIINLKALKAS